MKRKDGSSRQTKFIQCNKCNDSIGSYGFNSHYKKCNGISKNLRENKKTISLDKLNVKEIQENKFLCLECNKEFTKMGISSHFILMHTSRGEEIKKSPNFAMKGKSTWNKGLTKEKDKRLCLSDETKEKIKKTKAIKKYKHTDDFKEKQRVRAIKRGLGGVRNSCKIKYNGFILGSTYELQVVKSLDENNITWTTCQQFNYIDPNGKPRRYLPDIYLPEYNIYLDPKNDFLIENINPILGFRDTEKIKLVEQQNNIKILILNKNQLNWNEIKKFL